MIVEHGHRRLPPTGYETRTVAVKPGTGDVSYPVPTYDEQVTLGCPQCVALGASQERERIREAIGKLDLYDETVRTMAEAAESVLLRAVGLIDDDD